MTYIADETAHKTPVELYTFTLPASTERYTDTEIGWTHPISSLTFIPEIISRGTLKQSDEDDSLSVEVTVDALNPVAQFFRSPFVAARSVFVLIERTHTGASDAPAVVFRGQISQCVFQEASAVFTCVPTRVAIQREVPTILVQSLCTNTLYDSRCQANPTTFQVTGLTISGVSGTVITISGHGKPDGYFSGGTVTVAGVPAVTIREHVGNTFKLLYNYGFTIGQSVTLLPGCDKRLSTCISKFSNSVHHQGFPNMPQIDPFVDPVT